jgi:RNA polymerase sigma-70 factor, ECF subfamily
VESEATSLSQTADLLSRAKAGDESARDELFTRYRPRLQRFLRMRIPNAARDLGSTQDLVQEVCMRAYKALERFEYRGVGSFWAFLRTIGLNEVRQAANRAHRRGPRGQLMEESWNAPSSPDTLPPERVVKNEDLEAFETALGRIPDKQRTALLLRLELGMDFASIAVDCEFPSADAARMAVTRTIQQIGKEMTSG